MLFVAPLHSGNRVFFKKIINFKDYFFYFPGKFLLYFFFLDFFCEFLSFFVIFCHFLTFSHIFLFFARTNRVGSENSQSLYTFFWEESECRAQYTEATYEARL